MSNYLLLSPDTPLSQNEMKNQGSRIGKFLITAKRLRQTVLDPTKPEPNGTERMNRFRLLSDFVTFYDSDKACQLFREFIEFQSDYKDYKKWKKNHLDRNSHPGRGASGSVAGSGSTDPYRQAWMGNNYDTSTYSSGYSNRFGIDTMGISSIFENREREEPKLNYDDESEIEDFDELDADIYYDMLDRAYDGIDDRSRLRRATRGYRKFYTDIEIDPDDETPIVSENEGGTPIDDIPTSGIPTSGIPTSGIPTSGIQDKPMNIDVADPI
jgi:hypothetical protein